MAITLGNIEIRHPVFLAPMAGVTDYSFRRICRELGAAFTVSEMISAAAIHYGDLKTAALADLKEDETPCAVQLFGKEPALLAEAAYKLEALSYRGCRSVTPPSVIDINMGCPVKKVVNNGEGSALMRDPEQIYRIVSAVCGATSLPVSVKLRTGWDSEHLNAPECAQAAVSGGCRLICVHGRTREQFYEPPVDTETIASVKKTVGEKLPVIANGGIYNAKDALSMIEATGCDGVAVARGARENPYIFREITAALEGSAYKTPTAAERIAVAVRHIKLLKLDKGEGTALREARGHLSCHVRGMRGSSLYRSMINSASSTDELIELTLKLGESNIT